MKHNLKNPLWETNPKEAKKGLKKELREKIKRIHDDGRTDLEVAEALEDVLGE